jgi:hypothetical protein
VRDAYAAIVAGAFYLEQHHDRCTYSEGSQRMSGFDRPFALPFVSDCSAFVEDVYHWAGAPSPAGNSGIVYTGTELTTGRHIQLFKENNMRIEIEQVRPSDGVVFGPGTGVHIALIIAEGNGDPVCISMGQQGDPSIVRVSQMKFLGEQTYLRFDTMAKKLHWPPKT